MIWETGLKPLSSSMTQQAQVHMHAAFLQSWIFDWNLKSNTKQRHRIWTRCETQGTGPGFTVSANVCTSAADRFGEKAGTRWLLQISKLPFLNIIICLNIWGRNFYLFIYRKKVRSNCVTKCYKTGTQIYSNQSLTQFKNCFPAAFLFFLLRRGGRFKECRH